MPLIFEPIKADPRLKNLGLEKDKKGIIVKYGVQMDGFDGDTLRTDFDPTGSSPNKYRLDYVKISKDLLEYKRTGNITDYIKMVRHLAKVDLFFLMYFVFDMPVNHPFLMARIYEAQNKNHYTLDCWARTHWKSTILTCALPIFELINKQNERICIFSHTKSMAKSHLRKIKIILEQNDVLKQAYPEIFYENPRGQADKWSEDEGLYVKRKKGFAPGEASIEAQGLETLPTGKHYSILVFDDIIDLKGVSTQRQMNKALEQFEQADNLAVRSPKKRVIGTRYHRKDVYASIMTRARWLNRIYPGEVDETGKRKRRGIPVYLTEEELQQKREEQGEFTYSAQILQDPTAESRQSFKRHWLRSWLGDRPKAYLNLYILVDPAREKGASHDYTVMIVMGVDAYRNYWLVDMVRDKLDAGEKWEKLRYLVQKYGVRQVGYERYGMQIDIDYMKQKMQQDHVFFNIIELGGNVPKEERIRQLIPIFKNGRFIIPKTLPYRQEWDGKMVDLSYEFEEEYASFPFGKHDDIMDISARVLDAKMGIAFPKIIEVDPLQKQLQNGDPLGLLDEDNRAIPWEAQ